MRGSGLAAFSLCALLLGAATAACGGPAVGAGDQPQALADARATDVRRTAVANVQRIIANNPPATPTPPATALPRPSCPNAIWWHEARSHLGELRTVQGPIVATRGAADGATLLELGQPYPDPTGVAVVVPAAAAAPDLAGRAVCVAGRITAAEGRPTLLVRDRASIVLVN